MAVTAATLARGQAQAVARDMAGKLISTKPGRSVLGRGAAGLLGSRTGRRIVLWGIRRHARGTIDRIRFKPLLYVPAVVTLARLRRRIGPPPAPLTLSAVYATPAVIAYALPRGRPRTSLVWLAHMWAYKVAFEVPYDHPEKLRKRLRVDEPISIDSVIGLGIPVSERLQRRLRRPPELTLLDKALTGIYLFWEIEPHLALAWLLMRHPGRFARAAPRLALTYDATLLGYFATPTAPPWWASEYEGRMNGQVRRVVAEVMRALQRESRPGGPDEHESDSNPWASWPSDHFASALSAAMALAEAEPRAGIAGFGYAGALGFTLVYTGEHYVTDLLLGAMLALLIHGAGSLLDDRRVGLLLAAAQPAQRRKRLRRGRR